MAYQRSRSNLYTKQDLDPLPITKKGYETLYGVLPPYNRGFLPIDNTGRYHAVNGDLLADVLGVSPPAVS